MKYIIKNCPCYNKDYSCQSKNNIIGKYCKDIADCLLKRIVEKCKYQSAEFDDKIKNGNYHDKYKFFKSGRSDAGKEVLQLLEIEQVDENVICD